jgi:hypothetical protein
MFRRIKNILTPFTWKNSKKIFTSIYENDTWKTAETISGPGSTLKYTESLRKELPELLLHLKIKKLLDAPCGDYNWMSKTRLNDIDYTGADIVPYLIEKNIKSYPGVKFIIADITKDKLPSADAILCRDCFIHLQNRQIIKAIRNFKKAGIKYIITNTYPVDKNMEIITGHYRPVNMEIKPFYLPPPIQKINDFIEDEPTRYLGLWLLDDIKL